MHDLKKIFTRAVVLLSACLLSSAGFSGEAGDWRAPESVEGATTIGVEQAKSLFDQGAVFVDVRNPRLYARRHVPGAHHLDLKHAFTREALGQVAGKNEPVVIYCSGVKCSRSYRASEMALSWGYQDIRYFRGGIVDWRDAGMPMESGD